MTNRKDKKEFGSILRRARVMVPLTLRELATMSGVSASHLGRIEKGDRFPSARVLRKIAQPLDYSENDIFTLAGYMSPQPSEPQPEQPGRLDPYVSSALSQEPVEIQRALIGTLAVLRAMARAKGLPEFREYARRKYPELDEDTITMIEDLIRARNEG